MPGLAALLATLTLGTDTLERTTQGTASGQVAFGVRSVDNDMTTVQTVGSSVQLRQGASTDLAAAADARWDSGYDLGNGDQLRVLAIWLDGAVGNRPALDARRDVSREAYAATSVGFSLAPLFGAHGDRRLAALRFGFGGDRLWQGDRRRAQITGDVEVAAYCRLVDGGEPHCLHILEVDDTGVSGKQQATVTNVAIARATGLAGHFELGLGLVTDTVTIGTDAYSSDPATMVTTENLPTMTVLAGSVGAVARVGTMRLVLRGARTGYVSLDHDLSIEDRATLTASLPLDAHTTISASGFLAHTRWWSSATDPGSSAVTSGGELAVVARVHAFDVRASAGVAQSFYPSLDGAAPEAPALGMRSTVQLSRAIDL
jgi:hypothetical protein